MRSNRKILGILALVASTSLIYQNCGSGFQSSSPAQSSSNEASLTVPSLPTVSVSIINSQSSLVAQSPMSFSISGVIPADASVAWSNSMDTSTTCAEGNVSGPTYSLNCLGGGQLLVTVAVIEQGQVVGSSSETFTINSPPMNPLDPPAGGTTPVTPSVSPTPGPATDPTILLGQNVYNSNCASCHNPIAVSTILDTSADQVTSVITNNLGNSHNATGVKALIMTDATDAADLAALVQALSQ